jgi:3-methyladenine DNA glycosylase AlkD
MIIEKLKREIARYDKPENRLNYQKFFKEKLDDPVRIKTAVLRKISNNIFKEVKGKPSAEILDICDELLRSGERYTRFFAFEWARKLKGQYRKSDFVRFERWLKDYVDNWGACDHFCGITGRLLVQYPDLVPKFRKWTRSKNRWFRRAAAVSLIDPVTEGILLDEVFKTADLLLTDDDDMVQKGYGWMLKEAGSAKGGIFSDEVFKYVIKNKRDMPRTALRYAIEKYPAAKRKEAMKRD